MRVFGYEEGLRAVLIRDRYRLDEVLGRGGMGEVWRGRDEVLGRDVAVKLLTAGQDATAAARFATEARTAGRLNHPNTVAVYDFGSVDDLLFLVMELVDGYSLATEIAAFRRVDPGQAGRWGAQTASGLAAAHREGIVHRDIKPANLLLTRDGTLKISDFGIAHFAFESSAGLTSTGLIIGTASYLAPERALGRTAGPPADLYALGCVLYELLTGRPPFTADAPAALLHQHVQATPVDLREHRRDVPDALAGLVHRLLAKDPHARPTAEEAEYALGTGPATRVMPPLPDTPPTVPRRAAARQAASPRRRRIILGAAGAAAVTAIVVALVPGGGAPHRGPAPTASPAATTAAPSPTTAPVTQLPPAGSPPAPRGRLGGKPKGGKPHHH